jgi:hypothetical protein
MSYDEIIDQTKTKIEDHYKGRRPKGEKTPAETLLTWLNLTT